MQFSITLLEGKKLPRVIISIQPSPSSEKREIYFLMKKIYEMGAWCFDLPSGGHLEFFKELKNLTNDEKLIGLCHIDVEMGASLLGKPLHRFESKIISTIKKNFFTPHLPRDILPPSSSEVFTQKEIDLIQFDPLRLNEGLSLLNPETSPFLFLGGKYGDWLLALGRIDLLHEIVSRVREKGFVPIFEGQWATFTLPRAKPLAVAAYAFPINKRGSSLNVKQASDLIKKFDRPVISLNALANGKLLKETEKAFSFLFDELKAYATIVHVASEKEMERIVEALKGVPSFIPKRKT